MSQITDYTLNDAPRAAVLAKINLVNQALLTKNSGAIAPVNTYPYMDWIDTTTGLWKVRNAANTGWTTIGEINKPLLGYLLDKDAITRTAIYTGNGVASEAVFTFPAATKRILFEIEASDLGSPEGGGGYCVSASLNNAFSKNPAGIAKYTTGSFVVGVNNAFGGTRAKEMVVIAHNDRFDTVSTTGEICLNPSARVIVKARSMRIVYAGGGNYAGDSVDRYSWSDTPQTQDLSVIRFRAFRDSTQAAIPFPTSFSMKLYKAAV